MGIDYSYDVYVHRRDAGRLLRGVVGISALRSTERTTVLLPGGERVVLPGDYGFTDGREVGLDEVADPDGRAFGLVLSFPEDGPLRENRAEERGAWPEARRFQPHLSSSWPDSRERRPDGRAHITMGLVYLGVRDVSKRMPSHLEFSFTPAVTAQSRLFLRSPSIRETFAELAISVGAVLCLFDGEVGHRIVVTAGQRRVSARVPGPCLLWCGPAPHPEGLAELSALLDGRPVETPGWIIGPGHPEHAVFVGDLAESSRVPPELWLGA